MTETIALGGRQFELRPLTLGQLRRVVDALDGIAGKSGGALIEAAAEIVAAGFAPADPETDAAALLDLEATLDELNAAVAAILRLTGLQPAGLQPPGEADPRVRPGEVTSLAAAASDSAPSMPLSPPAAATPIV